MQEIAYRFVPDGSDGRYRETSRYVIVCPAALEVRSEVTLALHGHSVWEVVRIESAPGLLVGATNADGDDIPLGGTAICRPIR